MQSDIATAFAPTGVLRASINVGNPILARRSAVDAGGAAGVSVDLAQGLADRLGVTLELRVFDSAAQSVEAVASGQADVGFFAIDPKRAAAVAFTAPFVLIEGCYMVRDDSPLRSNEEVDAPGRHIAVGDGSAYDLFLTREIRHASLVRAPGAAAVVDALLAQRVEVAAGIRQQLQAEAQRRGGLRLLPGRFMVIRQAMGLPRARGEQAATYLSAYVEAVKSEGIVAAALARHGIAGAAVAPAGDGG
jgi:polar amino acid transport system substrate-binding protein